MSSAAGVIGALRVKQFAVPQIRMGKREDLGIIFGIVPLKRMLRPIIRTVLPIRF